jgi:hypothetical protein
LESLAATIRTDTPFSVRLSFGANGLSAGTGSFGQYDMSTNVGPALGSFALAAFSDTSVFLLPAGFTADSLEMGLFDNHWQGIIPEPASLSLVWPGLFAIRRRRRMK